MSYDVKVFLVTVAVYAVVTAGLTMSTAWRRYWRGLDPSEQTLLLVMTTPFWALVPFGYAFFGIAALFGWLPEGGWFSG